MAIQRTQTVSRNPVWSSTKRYKVNETVRYNNNVYQNITGFNSEPGVGLDWILLTNDITSKLDKEISNYSDVTLPLLDTDELLVNRSGTWYKVDNSEIGGGGTYLESFQYNTTSLCIFNFPATSNWTQQGGFFGMGAYGSARGDSSILDFLTLISSTASYGKVIGGIAPFDMELVNNLSFVTPNLNLVGGDLKLGVGYIELDYALGTISNATVITETPYTPNANGSIDLKTDFTTGITIPKGAIWLYSWAHTKASSVSSIYIQTMLNFKQV